jgi:hypothetical protein
MAITILLMLEQARDGQTVALAEAGVRKTPIRHLDSRSPIRVEDEFRGNDTLVLFVQESSIQYSMLNGSSTNFSRPQGHFLQSYIAGLPDCFTDLP